MLGENIFCTVCGLGFIVAKTSATLLFWKKTAVNDKLFCWWTLVWDMDIAGKTKRHVFVLCLCESKIWTHTRTVFKHYVCLLGRGKIDSLRNPLVYQQRSISHYGSFFPFLLDHFRYLQLHQGPRIPVLYGLRLGDRWYSKVCLSMRPATTLKSWKCP